jgi:exonuclease VII large subunit
MALSRLSPQAKIDNHRQKIDTLNRDGHPPGAASAGLAAPAGGPPHRATTALDPLATLSRGYAIIRKGETIVTHTGQIAVGDDLRLKLHDGEIDAVAQRVIKL